LSQCFLGSFEIALIVEGQRQGQQGPLIRREVASQLQIGGLGLGGLALPGLEFRQQQAKIQSLGLKR
jgi:hypothetical protein